MTSINVAEWEWGSQEHPPQFPARKVWRTAVAMVAASAKHALPEAHHRIDNAVKLILAGDVELLPDGTAEVASQSDPKTVYAIKGTGCTCPDALYRSKDGWCKHVLAVLIVKRATTLVKQQLGTGDDRSALAQERAPASAARAPKFQEAFVSCSLTFPLSGVKVTLTLYDTSEQALFPRIRHALAWAKTQGACKTDRQCLS